MENITKISRFFLFGAFLFFIFWLGGYMARHLFLFQMFEPEDLSLTTFYATQNIIPVFYSFSSLISFNAISFLAFFIFFSLFLLTSKVNLKREGWLLIITLIVYLTAPMEIFLITFDLKLLQKILSSTFTHSEILTLVKQRITMLGSFPLAEIFAYIFIIFLMLFRPFRMKQNEN